MLRNDYDGTLIDDAVELYFRILYARRPVRMAVAEEEKLTEQIVFPQIKQLVEEKKLGEAEDLLFEFALEENRDILKTGLLFYYELNAMSDDELEECGFSREELKEGVDELLTTYGLVS